MGISVAVVEAMNLRPLMIVCFSLLAAAAIMLALMNEDVTKKRLQKMENIRLGPGFHPLPPIDECFMPVQLGEAWDETFKDWYGGSLVGVIVWYDSCENVVHFEPKFQLTE